jgi:hypothetical protein
VKLLQILRGGIICPQLAGIEGKVNSLYMIDIRVSQKGRRVNMPRDSGLVILSLGGGRGRRGLKITQIQRLSTKRARETTWSQRTGRRRGIA